jgi:AraC-like DNA-binding protein
LCELPGVEIESAPATRVVRRCLDHLSAELSRPVSQRELAEICGVPVGRLRRLFAAATGLPPHAFHLQRRIQQGKSLLAGGTAVIDVALATGFTDQAHFTRHFTTLVGVSPARYASSITRLDGRPMPARAPSSRRAR